MTDELAKVVEVRLVSWGDGTKGPWIRIQFDHQDQLEEFRPLKTGSANGQRMAISFALIDDQEGTEPLDPSAAENPQKPGDDDPDISEYGPEPSVPYRDLSVEPLDRQSVGQARPTTEAAPGQASAKTGGVRPVSQAQQAGILCGAETFHEFLRQCHENTARAVGRMAIGTGFASATEHAAATVRTICKVQSRAEFDTDGAARKRGLKLQGEYHTWLSDRACVDDANERLQEAGEG